MNYPYDELPNRLNVGDTVYRFLSLSALTVMFPEEELGDGLRNFSLVSEDFEGYVYARVVEGNKFVATWRVASDATMTPIRFTEPRLAAYYFARLVEMGYGVDTEVHLD